jgi:hypothetical protein
MIVTFRPTINTGADYTGCYLNFLRCVTAIATASAGTTTLTVNPYTASNTIDTTKNCIVSIDNNTEAGGWITSASHSVPSSGNNTPTSYTALASATAHQYKADFYNASGKSVYPYKKLSFHWWADVGTSYNYWLTNGYTTMSSRGTGSANTMNNMLVTFGCSSTTDWTSTTFPPATNGQDVNEPTRQSTSYTLNGVERQQPGYSIWNGPGLRFNDTTVEYHMAVTADYCIVWESKVGDTYTAGYFTSDTSGNGTTYWNVGRGGSIYYMGLRETQPWENAQNNNVPWTCWQYTSDANVGNPSSSPFPANQVAAFMTTMNNNNVASTTPLVYKTQNSFGTNRFFGSTRNSGETAYRSDTHVNANKEIDTPLFVTRRMSNQTQGGETGVNTNMLYMPVYDTTTGLTVPPAVPIKISRCFTGDWNPGGACKGIYKSLSMPYTSMKLYWQASNQTYTIGTDTYLPFVIGEDMWLVRFA